MKEEKEIIGYKAPMDLWGGDVKKGSLFEKDLECPTNYTYNSEDCFRIAEEIVETWEPVYKETKTLPEINGYKGRYLADKGFVEYGCAVFNTKGITSFLENKDIGINRKIKSITLCSGVEITIDQLQQIADYFKD